MHVRACARVPAGSVLSLLPYSFLRSSQTVYYSIHSCPLCADGVVIILQPDNNVMSALNSDERGELEDPVQRYLR